MSLSSSVSGRRLLNSVFLYAFTLATSSATAIAQSTDKDHPTVVSSNEILGPGTTEKTDYYYAFSAEPGTVTLTFDVKSDRNASVAGFDYEVLDAQSKRLAGGALDPLHGEAKRIVDSVKVNGAGPQQLVLKLTITQSVEAYRVQLGRSVDVASAARTTSGPVAPAPAPAATAQAPVAVAATPTVAGGDSASGQTGENKLLNFEFSADNKIQVLKDLPSTGTLILEMKDGTTREIPLKDVKTVTVKSQ